VAVTVKIFPTLDYAEVEQYWNLWLSQRGLGPYDALSYDFPATLRLMFILLEHRKVSDFQVVIVLDEGVAPGENPDVLAVVPMYYTATSRAHLTSSVFERDYHILGEDVFIHYKPLIDELRVKEVIESLPAYVSYDLGYTFNPHEKFSCRFPYPIIEVKPLNEYIAACPDKHTRKEWERICRKNKDLLITYGTELPDNWQELSAMQFAYRREKDAAWNAQLLAEGNFDFPSPEMQEQELHTIIGRAAQWGTLRTVTIHHGDRLLCTNIAVVQQHGDTKIMCDYVTFRDQDPEYKNRSLGVYSILANLDFAHRLGCTEYDLGLTGEDTTYKQHFTNAVRMYPGLAVASRNYIVECTINRDFVPPIWVPGANQWVRSQFDLRELISMWEYPTYLSVLGSMMAENPLLFKNHIDAAGDAVKTALAQYKQQHGRNL